MEEQKHRMLELLQVNKGFAQPERWIDYGIEHNFQRVQAEKLKECPDCSNRSFRFFGQYVYYSTLISLQECAHCGLIFSDTRIDSQVIQSHWEHAYKDENYFQYKRSRIFNQIAKLVGNFAPQNGSVLDIGGSKGHLMAILKQHRHDLTLVLNDISKTTCDFAASQYGLETICGGVKTLEQIPLHFDVVIMSDVICYEPELNRFWKLLPHLVSSGGTVIIRGPNKLPLIRLCRFIEQFTIASEKQKMQSHIRFFNPELLYIFSRHYLLTKLRNLGFSQVMTMPSELLIENKKFRYALLCYSYFAKALSIFSHNKLIITPGFLTIARKQAE